MTATTLMILSARCALMMLADLPQAARSAAAANAARSGRPPFSYLTVTVMSWRLSGSCMSGHRTSGL
jgi:hypothetical protein